MISPLEVDPAEVGMDPGALAALDSLILAAMADSASPGAALAVGRNGKLVRLRGYGRLDWSRGCPSGHPVLHLGHGFGHQGLGNHHGGHDPG